MAAVVRITAESSLSTQSVNVWHYRIPNISPTAEVDECIDQLDTFYTAIATYLTAGTYLIGQHVVTVDQSPNVIIPGTSETSVTSGTGTQVLSAAAVLTIGSLIVGGSHRGRKYLGPLETAAVQSNGRLLDGTSRAAMISAAGALLLATTSGCTMGVYSRKNNSFTVASSVGMRDTVGTQRRRLF